MKVDAAEAAIRMVIASALAEHGETSGRGLDALFAMRQAESIVKALLATGYAELQGESPIELPRLAKPYTQEQLSLEIARLLPSGTT
jgi:hypothetical protein